MAKNCCNESNYKITRLPSQRYALSEVPHWDVQTQSLYFINVDGVNSNLNRYDYGENKVYRATIDGAPILLFILPINNWADSFLVGIQNKVVITVWDGRSPKATIIGTLFKLGTNSTIRINDVKTDNYGRFYGGTKNVAGCDTNEIGESSFYNYQPYKGVKKFFDGVKISNGLTWVRQTNKFYYVDSCSYDVKEFDYDPKTGDICKL